MNLTIQPILLIILCTWMISCQQNPTQQTEESTYKLDPARSNPPFPAISIPEEADTTTPRWKGIDLSPAPPVVPVSPAEELASFVLQPGYKMEAILTEPRIIEPAAIQFDGNGRMYVLELRTYMQDIDAGDELMPVSCISRWEDKDNDGIYETGGIFLDSLIFPRFVLPFGPNTILSMESNQDVVYQYTDTDGDGKADQKKFFADGMGRSGNVEHQTSFLTWALDNWMYSTYNSSRIRWTPEGVIQEPSGTPWGQWGVTQDDYGLVWMQDGAGGVPANFQFPIVYGNYQVEGQYEPGFRTPYSLVRLADFEPGMREVKPDGSLSNVTGSAGNDVFRGDRLPENIRGEYFYGEPVARIVRQVTSTKREGLTYLQNPYGKNESEFIQSTDPLFRPVDIATAPDGTMYIVDMYRGIIQEGTWTQQGSYLRTKIQQYQMDDVIRNGRIWRLTYEGMHRDLKQPKMFEESSSQLTKHLSHPNGWWRDKAQQLLILRQDRSVIPALRKMMESSDHELARIHALWTLEGLRGLTGEDAIRLMNDPNPNIRYQGCRAAETLYKYGQIDLKEQFMALTSDPDTRIVIQAMQSLYVLGTPDIRDIIQGLLSTNTSEGVQVVGNQLLENLDKSEQKLSERFSKEELALYQAGKKTFDTFCATCHGTKGLGSPTGHGDGDIMAPAFSASPRINGHPEYAVKVLLHGLTGAIEGREYESLMIAMNSNTDEYIASVISYIRNDFGNHSGFISPEYVSSIRKATMNQNEPYTYPQLIDEVPHRMTYSDQWKVSASSTSLRGVGSTRDPAYAFSYKGWRTDEPQTENSWFQIQFPEPVVPAEIRFESGDKEYPVSFTISTSTDGQKWKIVNQSRGNGGLNALSIEVQESASFVKIQTNEKSDNHWGMKNLTIFARKETAM